MANEEEILKSRRERAERLRAAGVELFPARIPEGIARLPELVAELGPRSAEELEASPREACVAGRIMILRSFGKAAFLNVQAEGAVIQVWVKRDSVGADVYEQFKLYEIGDFLWARGRIVRTKSGELTVEAQSIGFLGKTYRPLPEKFHGLQDVEERYRKRYLDLLTNPESRDVAVRRSRMVSALRSVLDARGFLEVETPILQPIYGGANALPFTTLHNTYDQQLFLRISFELYLKRLVVGGIDRVYEIGRDFRNEGISRKHNPEFSMLEVYQAYADYEDMMELTEALVSTACERVNGRMAVDWAGQTLDLTPPWPRRRMTDLIKAASGVDIEQNPTLDALRAAVVQARVPGVDTAAQPSWARLVDELFSQTVEPTLLAPCFVIDYPVELSPLAKGSSDHPGFVERFEAFAAGMELANAFSELNDPDEQRARFLEQARAREAGDTDAQPIDEDFVMALEHGMPPCGGMGMGIGRLAMFLLGQSNLRDVKLFPHLRPRIV
jgi:lysyl-tRNA synthetase, class II